MRPARPLTEVAVEERAGGVDLASLPAPLPPLSEPVHSRHLDCGVGVVHRAPRARLGGR